jgi:RNA polymerase sigma-70 factor (ECF subfamily)
VKLKDVDLPGPVLARARAGEPAALEAFYRACARPAYTLARRIVAGAAADDVVQDAFLDAFRGLPGYDGRAPLGIWFRSIVVRRCLMHLRSPWQRSRELIDGWLDARTHEPPTGVALDLDGALAQLPAATRTVVWLHDVEGYTHEEIAAALGRTASWSKSQLHRGHARLRHWLGDGTSSAAGEDSTVEDACRGANPT